MTDRTAEMQGIVDETATPEGYEEVRAVFEKSLDKARELDHETLSVAFASMAMHYLANYPRGYLSYMDMVTRAAETQRRG